MPRNSLFSEDFVYRGDFSPTEDTVQRCPHCGKVFTAKHSRHIYCSKKCKEKHKLLMEKNIPVDKECVYCGKKFRTTKYTQKYCSLECKLKAYKKEKQEKVCANCGKTFLGRVNKQFCCNACRVQHWKRTHRKGA